MAFDKLRGVKLSQRVRLTDRICETVIFPAAALHTDPKKRQNQRLEVRDLRTEGLELRVTPAGVKTWVLRYRRQGDGEKRTLTLGRFPEKPGAPGMTLADARNAAAQHRASTVSGQDPATVAQQRKAAPTFSELVAEWQTNYAEANRTARVRRDDQSMLDRYILPTLGGLKVHNIGRREISAMTATVAKTTDQRKGHVEGRKMSVRPNRVFELTRAILRWALSQGIIATDPTMGMSKPVKKEAPRERALTPIEIDRFWRKVELLPASPGLRLAMKLSLVTGQRISEVCGIEKSELTLDGPAPVWIVPGKRSKNGESSRVPLSSLAVELIRDALWLQQPNQGDEDLAESLYLFPARAKRDKSHGPILPSAAATALFRGRDKLGIDHFRVHDLRRTAATRMAEMGINPHTVSLILNHVSASRSNVTGKVYIQYSYDQEKRAALDAWAERLRIINMGLEGANVVKLPVKA